MNGEMLFIGWIYVVMWSDKDVITTRLGACPDKKINNIASGQIESP